MQEPWHHQQSPRMDPGAGNATAAAAAMRNQLRPRDETEAGPDMDQTDPFAASGDESNSEEFQENPAKIMAKHVISEDPSGDGGHVSNEAVDMSTEKPYEPAAASTPTRDSHQPFRIVDIEPPIAVNSGGQPPVIGDAHSALQESSHSAVTTGDANSAKTRSDDNSAKSIPSRDDAAHGDATKTSDAVSAGEKLKKKIQDLKSRKVPSMVPPVSKITVTVEEPNAIPSATFNSILNAKLNKLTPSNIPGSGPATACLDCGSFYNGGDNRIRHAVYKENVATVGAQGFSYNFGNMIYRYEID